MYWGLGRGVGGVGSEGGGRLCRGGRSAGGSGVPSVIAVLSGDSAHTTPVAE